jgi:hypothetical protein
MAQKKKVVSKRTVADGPTVVKAKAEPLGRGKESPALLRQAANPTRVIRLEPKSKVHSPIVIWGYSTEHGWTGWVEQFRKTQLKPTHWSNEKWNELPAVDPALAAEQHRKQAAGK